MSYSIHHYQINHAFKKITLVMAASSCLDTVEFASVSFALASERPIFINSSTLIVESARDPKFVKYFCRRKALLDTAHAQGAEFRATPNPRNIGLE